ncbi:16S rRNA (cytosine(1402)-N(4))-methyltransferase RsmH [Guyparkeria sp. SCN-R1]|uniref:16S rRNA (cytosine(1402)-N(4))-methyltransferase RsmH n=1 Tax=Guyparkeria sp. SCN-R1 TaxID=2341113 RepID=UPI000F646A2D|nr:16S rRNA (cytosine(1402)-N(4))-methyltransferase RsmH [Guyparkeria sp. SCN-R1]RRQ24672.1 16S rRNA (cytosine(1402)-N(4))-methyltransferase RsmH [Guyparkeria sp. SCN-R1]
MTFDASHDTVLRDEAVDNLVTDSAGIYVDGTFGRGGHSRAILAKLSAKGRLVGFDRDAEAADSAARLADEDSRFSFIKASFSGWGEALAEHGIDQPVDGVMFDLGVSSPQLDQAERGFSFRFDGPLDMRMDQSHGPSAADWLAVAEEEEIRDVLFRLGEERFARRIAAGIVDRREQAPLTRTTDLVDCVVAAIPRRDPNKHPATRTFQAIRLYINKELDEITRALEQALEHLAPGGRLVVISFHSLEDRIVKRFIRDHSTAGKDFFGNPVGEVALKKVGKAIRAGREETAKNPRARSAIMRVAERTS